VPFKTILMELVENTPGASGAILTDWEGEAVEQFGLADEYELKLIGAHKGIILNRMKEIHCKSLPGGLHDAVISTETHHIIVGMIDNDYSLIMTLGREALVPRAMREFRRTISLLKKEIC
jgi:predicted regulator of Ras-like GTPase activity (Roadblock/LC7/MglB family)